MAANETVFIAIYKAENLTLKLEYIPLENGALEIVSVDIQARPATWQEQRAKYQRTPIEKDVKND